MCVWLLGVLYSWPFITDFINWLFWQIVDLSLGEKEYISNLISHVSKPLLNLGAQGQIIYFWRETCLIIHHFFPWSLPPQISFVSSLILLLGIRIQNPKHMEQLKTNSHRWFHCLNSICNVNPLEVLSILRRKVTSWRVRHLRNQHPF